jgi:hypothetical protein
MGQKPKSGSAQSLVRFDLLFWGGLGTVLAVVGSIILVGLLP